MIIPVGRASQTELELAATIALEDKSLYDAFIDCQSKSDTIEALTGSKIPWHILTTDRPIALFALHTNHQSVVVDQLVFSRSERPDQALIILRDELVGKGAETIVIPLVEEAKQNLPKEGFQIHDTLIKFSTKPTVTEFMPILPLTNPSESHVTELTALMNEAYRSKQDSRIPQQSQFENVVRDVFDGRYGTYLRDCSHSSGMQGKTVSACLVTRVSEKRARIVQMFTHPLYRARGLATSEIAMAMNKMANRGISALTAYVPEANVVAVRLFRKLGFAEVQRIVRLSTRSTGSSD